MKKKFLKRTATLVFSVGMLTLLFSGRQLWAYAEESNSQIISNDASGIPDKALYEVILKDVDSNHDRILTQDEANRVTTLHAEHSNISDITGIQYLTNMTALKMSGNNISDISVLNKQNMPKLLDVYMDNNQIGDVSALKDMTDMKTLDLYN